MVQIGNTIVSFSIFTEYFCCDPSHCKGICCVEGDAGAPVALEEVEKLEEALPIIESEMRGESLAVVKEQGVVYNDPEGDLVTSIVNGKDCVFATEDSKGCTLCLIEKAFNEGRFHWRKPISCYLYPARLGKVGDLISVNFHKWDVCRHAMIKGRRKGIRVYEFLKQPFIERFGQEWYDELLTVAEELKAQKYI
ncbi:MAG: DUF3109 family protein [Bacteroidaceae bacterium]|nr:DUF3109 family protein [Bacteroidaceae bacterium]MBQ7362714.1 DUF3109 family protein [Bacteroidaceae bacterium]MBQ8735317.1 DUF3109 family protein [Bacteroidaceae bacterium]